MFEGVYFLDFLTNGVLAKKERLDLLVKDSFWTQLDGWQSRLAASTATGLIDLIESAQNYYPVLWLIIPLLQY